MNVYLVVSQAKADGAVLKGGLSGWTFLDLLGFPFPILLYVVLGKLLNVSELQFSSVKWG